MRSRNTITILQPLDQITLSPAAARWTTRAFAQVTPRWDRGSLKGMGHGA